MTEATDHFYLNQPEPNQSCLLAMRQIIMATDTDVTHVLKYGMPCFCYKGKMFCYLWTDKKTKEPYLLMVEGKHLHYTGLEQGTRKRMKLFRVNPNEDLPISEIKAILTDALNLYKNGVVKI